MNAQRGFGAIMAIVILVILASLAAAIVKFGTVQQVTSAQDVLSARAWQAAKAGNEWGLFQALNIPFSVANSSGIIGTTTIMTINDFVAAGVVVGMQVSGTGVGAGATVTSVNSATDITVSVANSGAVSGVLTFLNLPGIWQTCGPATGILDLHVDTGFWVAVTCNSIVYNEGETCTPACTQSQVRIFQIDSVACNSATSCPDNAMATSPNYIERMRRIIVTN